MEDDDVSERNEYGDRNRKLEILSLSLDLLKSVSFLNLLGSSLFLSLSLLTFSIQRLRICMPRNQLDSAEMGEKRSGAVGPQRSLQAMQVSRTTLTTHTFSWIAYMTSCIFSTMKTSFASADSSLSLGVGEELYTDVCVCVCVCVCSC